MILKLTYKDVNKTYMENTCIRLLAGSNKTIFVHFTNTLL